MADTRVIHQEYELGPSPKVVLEGLPGVVEIRWEKQGKVRVRVEGHGWDVSRVSISREGTSLTISYNDRSGQGGQPTHLGDRGVYVGGSVSGSTIITGDRNVISGKGGSGSGVGDLLDTEIWLPEGARLIVKYEGGKVYC